MKPLNGVRLLSLVKQEARELLQCVGEPWRDRQDLGQFVLHLRRPVTPDEYELLPAVWRAIPAIDLAGDGDHIRIG